MHLCSTSLDNTVFQSGSTSLHANSGCKFLFVVSLQLLVFSDFFVAANLVARKCYFFTVSICISMFTGHFCFFYERPACVFCPFLCQVVFVRLAFSCSLPVIYIHVLVICTLFQFGLIVSLSGMFGKLKYLLSM